MTTNYNLAFLSKGVKPITPVSCKVCSSLSFIATTLSEIGNDHLGLNV
nr:MAG TPA: hypothetical protein [Caudoviricetes sp.]DAR70479.1 MAG TPA: hypothetical protein [Caudoviricetes sp.]